MYNRENELIIFYSWLTGNNLQDIEAYNFDDAVFYDAELYKAIRIDKINLTQMTASKRKFKTTMTELSDCVGLNVLYRGALGDALATQRDIYISKLKTAGEGEADKWLNAIAEITNKINAKEKVESHANYSDNFFVELDARTNEKNPRYGISDLDKYTNGLHRGELVAVCARPGCGKSVFGLQVADNVMQAGHKVIYIPLEMTPYENFKRLIMECGEFEFENANELEQGLSEEQQGRIRDYLDDLEASGLFKMYYGLSRVNDIEKVVHDEEPFLVVIDQLSDVEPAGRGDTLREKYFQVTRKLKRIASDENVCILALHQLNRDSEDRDITLSSLAESDSVGRDSDVVIGIKLEKAEDENLPIKPETMKIVKNRNGEAGAYMHIALHGARARIEKGELRSNQNKNVKII